MEIKQERTGKKGEFYIEENGERIARIQYFHSSEDEINVYHTEVSEELQGEGIGEDLVDKVVKFARGEDLKIVASCPFAKKRIEEREDLRSVLA